MIEFNYNQVMSQARELRKASQELQTIVQKLKNEQGTLATAWRGESSDLFLKKAEELCSDINRTAKTACGVAGAVETAAKAVKAAEDAAKEIVKAVTGS